MHHTGRLVYLANPCMAARPSVVVVEGREQPFQALSRYTCRIRTCSFKTMDQQDTQSMKHADEQNGRTNPNAAAVGTCGGM